MAKNLKLNIKNTQIAEALNLKKIKKKVSSKVKKTQAETEASSTSEKKVKARVLPPKTEEAEKKPKVKVLPPKEEEKEKPTAQQEKKVEKVKLGPILDHPSNIAKKKREEKKLAEKQALEEQKTEPIKEPELIKEEKKQETPSPLEKKPLKANPTKEEDDASKIKKPTAFKDFKDFKAARKNLPKTFDSRDRLGLRGSEDGKWRKKKHPKARRQIEDIPVIRPTELSIKLPMTLKDLASEMKLKVSELISKLFMQGIILTLNDFLDDETTVQLLGHEFGCEITIDTSEEKRLNITDKTIKEEITEIAIEKLISRPPIITFMGHVDHGKTSIIDAIRKSNITAQEAGAITQHIGAFTAETSLGPITILDTPGHEAFSEMRLRGALVTDIVVLVIAGDEGIKDQTIEAINQAKEAKVPIVVAINKSDKGGFDPEKVYRQLSDLDLLPEAWGGTIITVNCSAVTKEGIKDLLEMLSLQSEILELKADPNTRARGSILESEMHKGLGIVATVLVQNGTLRASDSLVFDSEWGKIKTMHDQNNKLVYEAKPSIPVKITGLSSLAPAGSEFIVVSNEKEARQLAHDRGEEFKVKQLHQTKARSLEHLMQQKKDNKNKKILPLILRADVQGSLEALINSLKKILSDKVEIAFVNASVGEISESDIDLATASKASIIGFHTRIESRAEPLIKKQGVTVYQNDIIYHVIDKVKELMKAQLDKIAQENDTGKAIVKTVFKSSQVGNIAGCQITDGNIKRNNFVRVIRNKEEVWKGKIASIKRLKDDVKEVQKGFECGIILDGFSDFEVDDILEAFEITYLEQEI